VLVLPLCEVTYDDEDAMTNEDDTADATRVSNWTLATGTKPGAREVYSPTTTVKGGPVLVAGSRAGARASDFRPPSWTA
jgi:hypothetical protein